MPLQCQAVTVRAGELGPDWPMIARWALGLLVGINLITSGWAIVMTAFAGRNVA